MWFVALAFGIPGMTVSFLFQTQPLEICPVHTRVHCKDVQLEENWSKGMTVFQWKKLQCQEIRARVLQHWRWYALEQVNRTMKVMGGLKGITQRPNSLARYFLAAPELARLALEADKMVDFMINCKCCWTISSCDQAWSSTSSCGRVGAMQLQ